MEVKFLEEFRGHRWYAIGEDWQAETWDMFNVRYYKRENEEVFHEVSISKVPKKITSVQLY